MVRKSTNPHQTQVNSRDPRLQPRASGKDVIVPLVLWDEPPRVEISTLHVFELPLSQPSQNSSHFVIKDETEEASCTQLCAFAGTKDGHILYWRYHGASVAQVHVLVLPLSNGSPVVGILSGTDEWGQSIILSATKAGALAKWQLPNGACADARATIAKELAPVLGLEVLTNQRFALVASALSRLMVLDTWTMELLYCMDTAQEQLRQSLAVGEIYLPYVEAVAPTLRRSSSGSTIESPSPLLDEKKRHDQSSVRNSVPNGTSNGRPVATLGSPRKALEPSAQRWDAIVLSLGTQGLLKCFLWTQPRGTLSGTRYGGTKCGTLDGFGWVQRTSWVMSWADQADDITCSQSTSLKKSDNMNPQSALMGSIKSSYFPRSVHVSFDSSHVLLIWQTKFVVLKRKWLCSFETRREKQRTTKSFGVSRVDSMVGSCAIAPSEFVRQAAAIDGNTWLASYRMETIDDAVCWENGTFLRDGSVLMWTNFGHVFHFLPREVSDTWAGKIFIFTKEQDQLVPRSDSKGLQVIDKAVYLTLLDRCKCCDRHVHKRKPTRLKPMDVLKERQRHPGFTACVKLRSFDADAVLKVVHVCHRGTLGVSTVSLGMAAPKHSLSTLGNLLAPPVPVAERVQLYSLADGFEAVASALNGAKKANGARLSRQRQTCLAHLILGRDNAYSSSLYEVGRRAGRRRKRQPQLNDKHTSAHGSGTLLTSTAAAVMASNVSILATALAPVTARTALQGQRREVKRHGVDASADEAANVSYRYLLDIPLLAKGFSDGMLYFGLLSQEYLRDLGTDAEANLNAGIKCHSGQITALAHCLWELEAAPNFSSNSLSPGRVSMEEACFATKQNPFHRSRFSNVPMERTIKGQYPGSSRGEGTCSSFFAVDTLSGSDRVGLDRSNSSPSWPFVKFFVFSGGTDGVFQVIDLRLFQSREAKSAIRYEAKNRFCNHRGAIEHISISPLGTGNGDTKYPDRWVATVGTDRKVVLYAPQYSRHAATQHGSSRTNQCRVEWKCVFELADHGDRICSLEWQIERGLLYVECEDRMVYVWSLDTGILERAVPSALLYGDDNESRDSMLAIQQAKDALVEHSTLFIGTTAAQLIDFAVLQSAERLKKNWTSYYASILQSNSKSENHAQEVPSLYATDSMELWMLSLVLSWGATPAIDQSCRAILGIQPNNALCSCAILDVTSGALTIPLPWITPPQSVVSVPGFARNWQHSSALSASIALGVISFCMSCMEYKHSRSGHGSTSPANKEEFQVLWSQLITQHSIVLPESIAQFREPALEELAAFGFDSCEYTQLAARTLLSGVIKRLSAAENSTLSAEYSAKLHWEMVRLEMETGTSFLGTVGTIGAPMSSQVSSTSTSGSSSTYTDEKLSFTLVVERLGSLVLLMSMIGTYFPGEISPASAREVCDVLVYLLKAPERFVASVSAELLTKGLMLFRPHLVDLSSLIVQLLLIDMCEKQRSRTDDTKTLSPSGPGGSLADFSEGGTGGSHAAMSLLVEVGAYESAFVLGLLQQEMHNQDRPAGFHESVLLYMMELLTAHYLLLCRHLPAFVDTIMASLEPSKPERRRRCLSLSTRCLHSLVRRFPMVDFHQETQRLALGTMEAVIVIYDLRTATKWRVLDGHGSAVSAVRFRLDGQVLVSYAARDGSVRWWNSGNAGLFGGMLKMHQSCLKEHKLAVLREHAHGRAPSSTGGTSAGLKQIIQTCRFQFLPRQDRPDTTRGSTSEQLQHVLRLTREDASQVQFLL